jgi:hypothetical protein
MTALRFLAALLALASVSCSSMPQPVPVTGSAEGISALAGNWTGDYWSTASGRNGSIRFALAAGRDTAFGEVTMVPRKPVRPNGRPEDNVVSSPTPATRTLQISFVHAAGDSVSGSLEPYQDPDCGCTLRTWFTGRLSGEQIHGRYTSLNTETGQRIFGEWTVRRQALSE